MEVEKATYEEIKDLRSSFLKEHKFQIRYDSCHWRGWADEYLFKSEGIPVGYGSIKGKEELIDRDTVFEFFLLPSHRELADDFFLQLSRLAQFRYIECQSNDPLLPILAYKYATAIHSPVILFQHHKSTDLPMAGTTFRPVTKKDNVFGKKPEDVGDFVLVKEEKVVADGGYLTHYNRPFVDLYMEVAMDKRGRGYAALILQEITKLCLNEGSTPAARCNFSNPASKGALLKAGFKICGCMMIGEVKAPY